MANKRIDADHGAPLAVEDEPGMAERFQRGLRRFLSTPPQPHGRNPSTPPTPKAKERPASKGRAHKSETRG